MQQEYYPSPLRLFNIMCFKMNSSKWKAQNFKVACAEFQINSENMSVTEMAEMKWPK